MRTLPLVLVLAMAALAQEKGSIYDTKYKYEKSIKKIQGVLDVSVGGPSDDLQLIVRVDSEEAKKSVRDLIGEKLDGFKVHIIVSSSSGGGGSGTTGPGNTTASEAKCNLQCPVHCRSGSTTTTDKEKSNTKADRALNGNPYEECDIMRKYLGLGRRKDIKNGIVCEQMIGWTNDPNKVKWAQKEGLPTWPSQEMSGFTCYSYIKHRQFCPLGMKQIIQKIGELTPGK